jgi:large subunit ribosomal protein L17
MRHRKRSKRFSRDREHLKAMMRNMASSLFRHERIITTPEKAKECRRFAERLVTLAKKGGLANLRRTISLLQDKEMAQKLFKELAPRYATRQGGYTRILRLAELRVGDRARQCIFELVEGESSAKKKAGGKKAAKPRAEKGAGGKKGAKKEAAAAGEGARE